MNTYMVSVMLQVQVEAFSDSDATEVITDCFGEGDFCGVDVQSVEVLDFEELS